MRNRRASNIRTESAFEGEPNRAPYSVYTPTEEQYKLMNDRLMHGEMVFCEKYPELVDDYDFWEFIEDHPELKEYIGFEIGEVEPERISLNPINELLAGPKRSIHDFAMLLKRADIWHESDMAHIAKIKISEHGCWEMPKYIDHIQPDRARYPQPRAFSPRHGDIRKQMGAAWMWERLIGVLPDEVLESGKRAFWGDHRCNNKACVYPRHVAFGKPEANDAFTARMDAMEEYDYWTSHMWARPSFAYPDGLGDIVHESEVRVLSDRAVILPIHMSRKEFDECMRVLPGLHHLPDGGYTTDPGYHVLFGAIRRGLDFDEETGCWNTRFDLDGLAPHKKTVVHACGNQRCVNFRHMDIATDQKKYFQIQPESYITLPNGEIVNTNTGELLPSYWKSWMLYWNWLRANSNTSDEEDDRRGQLLSATDFGHVWVHPLTGCWENERFYPRWSKSGAQMNAYGFHRSSFGELGRSMHRYLLYKYMEHIGMPVEPDLAIDADHCCDNRRCCNPLHMQFTDKAAHNEQTRRRQRNEPDDVARLVKSLTKLRKLGRRR